MNPGLLDRELTILQRVSALDGARSPVHAWTPLLANLPARRVSSARVDELLLADDVRSRVTEIFQSHYLDPKDDLAGRESKDFRIEFEDGIYDVIGIYEDAKAQRRQASIIVCTKVTGRVHNG